MSGFFQKMIQHLREQEEIVLYNYLLFVPEHEQKGTADFLGSEFRKESATYPYPLAFHPKAALWAANTIYTAASLILYREQELEDLDELLPEFKGEITAEAILSADLCLRFLPDILRQIKLIDIEDTIAVILEKHLKKWHYSGISYQLPVDELNFDPILDNDCLLQLYVNRVCTQKRLSLAKHPAMTEHIRASMGIYTALFWKELETV